MSWRNGYNKNETLIAVWMADDHANATILHKLFTKYCIAALSKSTFNLYYQSNVDGESYAFKGLA